MYCIAHCGFLLTQGLLQKTDKSCKLGGISNISQRPLFINASYVYSCPVMQGPLTVFEYSVYYIDTFPKVQHELHLSCKTAYKMYLKNNLNYKLAHK